MSFVLWWFSFLLIICIERKENEIKKHLNYSIKVDNKLKENLNSKKEKRNLDEEIFEPIKIIVDSKCLNSELTGPYKYYLNILKKSLNIAKETLENLIKVKKKKN